MNTTICIAYSFLTYCYETMEEITFCFHHIHFTFVRALNVKSFMQWTTAVFLNVTMREVRVTLDESHLCLLHHLHPTHPPHTPPPLLPPVLPPPLFSCWAKEEERGESLEPCQSARQLYCVSHMLQGEDWRGRTCPKIRPQRGPRWGWDGGTEQTCGEQ